jgi:hypothetical protein
MQEGKWKTPKNLSISNQPVLETVTNISEEIAACVFRVEVMRAGMEVGYIRRIEIRPIEQEILNQS